MYVQHVVEAFYLGLIAVYTIVIGLFIYATSRGGVRRRVAADGGEPPKPSMDKREKIWLLALIAVAIVGNAIFLSPVLPSMTYSVYLDDDPAKTVVITVEDHEFRLPENPIRLRVGEPVEFIVYSRDLTYGFGVFREDGTMVFQMQVVPNYENRIVWVFDEPGYYTIRSTEYSGPEHPFMVVEDAIVVEGGG